MPDEGGFLERLLGGLGEGDPFSYVVVVLALAAVGYGMWRLLRDELPPKNRIQWVRLMAIVVAGGGAIIGILGLVAEFSFAPGTGQHAALLGSGLFFCGFLVALISLTVELNTRMRGQ
jgi:hypothetical protein